MRRFEDSFNKTKADIAQGQRRRSARWPNSSRTASSGRASSTNSTPRLPEKYVWITLLEPTVGGKPVALGDPGKPLAGAGDAAARPRHDPGRGGEGPAIDGLHVQGLYLVQPGQDRRGHAFRQNLLKSNFFKLDMKNEKSGHPQP